VPGVTDVLQLAGWQQLTEVRLFCSRSWCVSSIPRMGLAILGIETNPKISETLHFQGKFTTETQRARRFRRGSRGHTLRRFGRRAALRVAIHPSSSNYHEQTPNFQTRKNADNRSNKPSLPCRSWCSLCLRGEIFFLRDLVARSSTAVRYAVCEA
jgi:hypothetical protein